MTGGSDGSSPAARRDWRFWALLGLFGLVVGLHLLTPRLDADQAVTGLMGWHVLRGEFPVFFWSQHHAGVPESYGAAVTFFVFGLSRLALNVVPALAALGLVLLLYRTGAVLFGPPAGLLAMLFATIVSPYVAAHYERARAYYIEHLLLGQVVLLGAALWLARGLPPGPSPGAAPAPGEGARTRILLAMGLAGGVGLYCGFQIAAPLVPAVLALLLVDPWLPARRGAWVGLAAFLVGSAPFWAYNLTHDWATFVVGERFQASMTAAEAGRHLFLELLPILLGVKEWIGTPPYLPWPIALGVPALVGGALALLAGRALLALPRLRRSPERAAEAFLVVAAVVPVGLVWYGRYIQVPRYLLPLSPVLALVLARACQLVWRRSRALAVVAAALYLGVVGVGLVSGIAALSPDRWRAYWRERRQDDALFAFLRAQGLTRAYSYEYWVAPQLTFDAGERPIVAQPFNDRYPAYTQAVDASPRPAYILRNDFAHFESWLRGIQSGARRKTVATYAVYWDFPAPPAAAPIRREGWRLRTSPGRGEAESLIDGRLHSGWASAKGPAGSATVDVDLGQPRLVSGVTLVTDRSAHGPERLAVLAGDGRDAGRRVARLDTGGFTIQWRDGAPRTRPGRTLTVRFPAVEARRLRLVDEGAGGTWAVAELFVLRPAAAPDTEAASRLATMLAEGRRLEGEDRPGPALVSYRRAMRLQPDAPEGYAEFARLASEVNLQATSAADQAARYARWGLIEEAREAYAGVAASLGPDRTYVELTRRRAELASELGDLAEARALEADIAAAAAVGTPVGVTLGRVVELVGCDLPRGPVRPGDVVDVVFHWRLLGPAPAPLAAYLHFRGDQGVRTRFEDDHPLPAPLQGLGPGPQHVRDHRRVLVPPDAEPGRYRLVAGVWNPGSRTRLHQWWRGLVPTFDTTVEIGAIEVVPRP